MRAVALPVLILIASVFAGCISDDAEQAGDDAGASGGSDGGGSGGSDGSGPSMAGDSMRQMYAQPDYRPLPKEITGLTHVAHLPDIDTGAGIWLDEHFAYVGARGSGFYIANILDPAEPTLASASNESNAYGRDVDILDQGDRKLMVTAGQGAGMHIWDVTNPFRPFYITTIMGSGADVNASEQASVHNLAVPPGQTKYVYNSQSNGEGGEIDVVDLSDPEDPKIASRFGTHGCHDITFLDLPNKKRAYCAGIEETQIYDLSDNYTNPAILGRISVEDAPWTDSFGAGLQHLAMPNIDGTILIMGDEFTGGLGPGCESAPGGRMTGVQSPIGALTFFDISDEANPVAMGWVSPEPPANNTEAVSCTAHFGTLIEDRTQLVMAWYGAGTVLVDFSDPNAPFIQDQMLLPGTNVWDARFYQGYVVTGDIARGMDVLTFV